MNTSEYLQGSCDRKHVYLVDYTSNPVHDPLCFPICRPAFTEIDKLCSKQYGSVDGENSGSNKMWNSSNIRDSNSSNSSDLVVAIASSCLALLHILAIVLTVVNFILLLAIRDCQTVSTGIRVVLCNIVVANQVFLLSLILYVWSEVSEIYDYEKYDMFWRVAYVALCSTAAARLLFMATYGVIVYIMARLTGLSLQTEDVGSRAVAVTCIVVWLVAIVPNLSEFLTLVHEVTINTVSTFCMGRVAVFYLDYSLIILSLYGIVCGFLSILFPLLTAHYSQKVILGEKRHFLKRMTKFSIFLLLSNAVNFTGIYVPLMFTSFYVMGCEEYFIALDVIRTAAVTFSLISTPVVMLAFFECVREKFKNRICCCWQILKCNSFLP